MPEGDGEVACSRPRGRSTGEEVHAPDRRWSADHMWLYGVGAVQEWAQRRQRCSTCCIQGERKYIAMLVLLIILLLLFGVGGGYYGHSRWGTGGGAGVGLGTILLILLLAYMLGIVH